VKRLIGLVGLPRSGKSSLAKELAKHLRAPIVEPDAVRLSFHGKRFYAPAEPMVWAVVKLMVKSLFQAGHEDVIFDATNVTMDRRRDWLSSVWKTQWLVVDTPPHICIERAIATGYSDLVPVISRMSQEWEPLSPEEGEVCWDFIQGKLSTIREPARNESS
jgi:predicted kinase